MRKLVFISLVAVLLVGVTVAAVSIAESVHSDLFKANVEVLAEGEGSGAGGGSLGTSYEVCGRLRIVGWQPVNCTGIVQVCNFKGGGCEQKPCTMCGL